MSLSLKSLNWIDQSEMALFARLRGLAPGQGMRSGSLLYISEGAGLFYEDGKAWKTSVSKFCSL
jgi:hypothetical protein